MLSKKRYVSKVYERAPAFARIFARAFDLILVFGIWVMVYFIFQIDGFNNIYFFIASIINILISLIYFIFFLYMFGQTFFMFLFKIKLFNQRENKTKLIIKIIRHELFLTISYNIFIFAIAIFILGIGQKDSIIFFRFLFTQVFTGSVNQDGINLVPLVIQIFAYLYSAFSISLSFIFIIIIGSTIYKSRKKTWIDSISYTDTLWLKKDKKLIIKKEKNNTLVDMPGVFDSDKIIVDKENKYE